SVTSHVASVHVGDRIYFYRFGQDAAVVAIGQVSQLPEMRARIPQDFKYLLDPERSGDAVRAVIRIVGAVSPPITREEILAADLGDLAVLKAQGGTNFQVSSAEADALETLIASRSLVAPERSATLVQLVESFSPAAKTPGLNSGDQHER